MKNTLFKRLLLFALFGIALGFFGMLYEGVVIVPKMLDTSMERMLVFKAYYSAINPLPYYIPLVPLATLVLVVLYFMAAGNATKLRTRLLWAGMLQITGLAITFYIVKIIDLKTCYAEIAQFANVIPAKVVLVNVLSVVRLVLVATGLILTFSAYLQTQIESKINN